MADRRYIAMIYRYIHDNQNGLKGDVSDVIITDRTDEECKKLFDFKEDMSWAAVRFPISRYEGAEKQITRARALCSYMNKVLDAQASAEAGISMGFLK